MADGIAQWLEGLGLGEHAQSFAENGVGLDVVAHLSDGDLKELGLNLGDRRRLQAALEAAPPPAPAANPARTGAAGNRPPDAERRQVTVLFADITGYTKLSTELDAEELHALLGRFVDRVDAIIHDHGGTVDKHVGDNVMAVFGAPVAHSDDSLRAVRTATAIHEAMPDISEAAGRQLRVHIGIASGQVVASGIGSDTHYTMTGESVNLASRLTDAASADETLISAGVLRAVENQIACAHRGELTVKGFAEPIPTYLVTGVRTQSASLSDRLFVGREAELGQFRGVVPACTATGTGQALYVRGEAGIGKTRLASEFSAIAAADGFDCHRTLILDFGVGKGQGAIHALVRSLLDIPQGGDRSLRLNAAERVLASGLLDREQAMFLNDLLDLPQPPELRSLFDAMENAVRSDGKRRTVVALVRAISRQQPLFLIFEDLHWADRIVVQQLADIARAISDRRAILAMTSRIEGDPLDQAWRVATAPTPLMTLDLRPLRPEDAIRFAADFIDASSQFALNCVERAEGNPLFLEQLLRSAEEAGATGVPDSVQSVVQSRLDSLDPPDRRALLAASVLGQRFSLGPLRHLISDDNYDCRGLLAHCLVRPEGNDFLFAHALVLEGVYDSLLKARRAALHRDAAQWYATRDLALRAEHLDRAGDPMAAQAYCDAARGQIAELQFDNALELAGRGIELAGDEAIRCDLTCLRAEALRNTGATDESITGYETALQSAPDDARKCRAWIGMAGGLRIADRQERALEILDMAETAAASHDLDSERAQIHYLRGNVYFPLGNIEGCVTEHERALGFARAAGSAEAEALALGGLGDGYYLRGQMKSACERFRACVALCREHGFGRIEVANRHMVGWTRIHLMEFEAALEDGLAAAAMAARVSHHRAEMIALMLAARMEQEFGRTAESRSHLERALELTRMIGAGNFEAQCLYQMGWLRATEGDMAGARRYSDQAVAAIRRTGVTFIGPAVLAFHAVLSDDPEIQKKTLREAEEILDSGCVAHNNFWFGQIALDHALAQRAWDEVERYALRLETYMRDEPLNWPEFLIARARALAAWGRGDRDANLAAELKRLHQVATETGQALAAPQLKKALLDF